MKPLNAHRLLVVGSLDYASTSWSRLKVFRNIFNRVEAVGTMEQISGLHLWAHLLTNHLYSGPTIQRINRQVLEKAQSFKPEILWVEKGLHLRPDTLKRIRAGGCRLLIHFSPDNQTIRGNQSQHYLGGIPIYDLHVTNKTRNVDWLIKSGALRVELIGNGFDPNIHRPVQLTPEDMERFGCDIGFVGHWEPSREKLLLWLLGLGYRMKVHGGRWERARNRRHPLFAHSRHLVGDEYAKALCGAKINLCLLSEWFGDQTTTRSIEIPACGKFMLAERNEEHLALFREGVEAEFYGAREEMLEKAAHYLQHEDEREKIGRAGLVRCLAGYRNEDRLRDVFGRIFGGAK